ncbi:MAG: NAD(P)/FAD-dependent oxidoreductase [Leucobacter sp.]
MSASGAPRRIVIAGGGIAGVTAAETLRRGGFDGELVIVGDEPHAAYSRPALSKAALLEPGDSGAGTAAHRLPDPEHGATELRGVAVSGLDLDRSTLRLRGGEELPFDRLLVATGSRARRLSDARAEFTLRGLDDAIELRRRLSERPEVVVIGGGPLGMEIASGCLASGCRVTLIARSAPLSSQLGGHLGQALTEAGRAAGLRLRLAQRVGIEDVERGDGAGGARVRLVGADTDADSGTVLEAPLVISAVGDLPNLEWLAPSGLLRGGELRVDSRGRATDRIAAAGDVAAFPGRGGHRRLPLWTSAIEQAKVAALALLQGEAAAELDPHPYFWTEQFGIALKVCGELPVAGAPEILDGAVSERSALLRWAHPDGTATAAALGYRIPVPRLRVLSRPPVAANV